MPLIAMEYAFGGGASQDPAGKVRRRQHGRRACSMKAPANSIPRPSTSVSTAAPSNSSFSSTRDYFRGSLRMLKDNKDEAFDLLRMSLTSPHFDTERRRADPRAGDLRPAARHHQPERAGEPQIPRNRLRRSSLWPAVDRHAGQRAEIDVADLKDYVGRVHRQRYACGSQWSATSMPIRSASCWTRPSATLPAKANLTPIADIQADASRRSAPSSRSTCRKPR